MQKTTNHFFDRCITAIVGIALVFFGFPFDSVPKAQAADFSFQSGYYIGDGTDDRAITGLGFSPDFVWLKDSTFNGNDGVVFKTSVMAGELSLNIAEAEAALTTNHIKSLDADGFTLGTDSDVNGEGVAFYWIAVGGSDCSASGTFCVGSYIGNGSAQNITSVGFQPNLVAVKRSGTSLGVFKTTPMLSTDTAIFSTGAHLASGAINSLDATGFSIGNNAVVNANGQTYYYFAFKEVSGKMDVGVYTGNATDSRIIDSSVDAGLTFQPEFVMVKGDAGVNGIFSHRHFYGDYSSLLTDAGSAINSVQFLYPDGGFNIGTTNSVNSNGTTYHYFVLGGSSAKTADDEEFEMINGSYTGTGSAFSVTGLPFPPDLVIVKHQDQATDQHAVWKSRLMPGDITHYFGNNLTYFSGGITSLTSDGFSLGTSATVNTSGDTYYWTAFGNASRPDVSGNSENFALWSYIASGSFGARDIYDIPIDPDFVAVKGQNASHGYWKTTSLSGDASIPFHDANDISTAITDFLSNGFIVSSSLSSFTIFYDVFLFSGNDCSSSGNFCVGSYTGTGSAQDITSVGFQPDFLWVKKQTGGTPRAGTLRSSVQTGDSSSSFVDIASLTGEITDLISTGFSLGSGNGSNEDTFTYQFSAWNAKRYTQSNYRFFENTDSSDVGSVLAAQDTPADLASAGDAFRLRMLIRNDYGNLFESGQDFKLQYVDKGAGTCSVPSGGTPASYTDVTGATLIAFNNNASPGDGAALTGNANDPTDGGRTIVNQSYVEANPFTNSEASILNTSQDGKWDFSLVDNGADPETTFCFRAVFDDGSLIDTYSAYPEITTAAAGGAQEISMTISDNSIGFGELSSSAARYATGDTTGSGIDSVDAHTISASTNADGGYVITINGTEPTCSACGGATINAIGATPESSTPGTEQFGLRAVVNSGTGTVSAPYDQASQFAFDTASFPDQIGGGDGDAVTTEFGVRYIGNIGSITEAGEYSSILTYTITASF